ncbi:hypothetical protein ACFQWF_15510 [Methylorubrum suomiense]
MSFGADPVDGLPLTALREDLRIERGAMPGDGGPAPGSSTIPWRTATTRSTGPVSPSCELGGRASRRPISPRPPARLSGEPSGRPRLRRSEGSARPTA